MNKVPPFEFGDSNFLPASKLFLLMRNTLFLCFQVQEPQTPLFNYRSLLQIIGTCEEAGSREYHWAVQFFCWVLIYLVMIAEPLG